MASKEAGELEGEVGYKVIRKNFQQLCRAVVRGSIPEGLYSVGLITDEVMDLMINPTIPEVQKGRRAVREVQGSVQLQPSAFATLIEILGDEVVTKDLSISMKEAYESLLVQEQSKARSHSEDTDLCRDFEELRGYLEVSNRKLSKGQSNEDELYKTMKKDIQNAIQVALKYEDVESVRSQMLFLCQKALNVVPVQLRDWAVQEVGVIYKAMKEEEKPLPSCPPAQDESPLFTKETLYHASLCCEAVSTCTTADYKSFFNNAGNGHHLNEISMSISKDWDDVDRYIIAKQENNIIYMAFQSEPTLARWMKTYQSFADGLNKQMDRIPLRFLQELIGKQHRIVFTGFSFGGMLAACNAARLWKETCFSVDMLKKNVVCITFGQPPISIPYVDETIKSYPKLEDALHSIYDQEDLFPKLLRNKYGNPQKLDEVSSLSPFAVTTSGDSSTSQKLVPLSHCQGFEGFLRNEVYSPLAALEEQSYSGTVSSTNLQTSAEKIKSVFSSSSSSEADIQLYGESYLISVEHGKGLQWTVSKNLATMSLLSVPSEKLQVSSFKKHLMKEYRPKLSRAYLEVEPVIYAVPMKSMEFTEVPSLKPEVKTVSVHKFPDEHTIAIEGNNLWFCHEVHLGEGNKKFRIKSSDEVTGRLMQFRYEPTGKTEQLLTGKKVKVALHSHFSNPIRKQILIEQEACSFSFRQIQLAKHTPSEIIMLAFSCAMLEQYSEKQVLTPRLKDITTFLEEAVQVVPIESIFHAIAYNEKDAAVQCAKALLHAEPNIPCSNEILCALNRADIVMRTGIDGREFDTIVQTAIKFARFPLAECVVEAPSCEEVVVTVRTGSHVFNPPGIPPGKVILTLQSQIDPDKLLGPLPVYPRIADRLEKFKKKIAAKKRITDAVCGLSIEHVYPVHSERRHSMRESILKSPIQILEDARKEISVLLECTQDSEDLDSGGYGTQPSNEQVLALVQDVNNSSLKICASLIGGFMEQQIRIPLLKSEVETAYLISETSSPVAMGAWILFNRSFDELKSMIAGMRGSPLLLEIGDYVSVISSDQRLKKTSHRSPKYAAKLQFLLQSMLSNKPVTCSSKYISYSLERQLASNLKFDKKIKVKTLIAKWDEIFKGDALSLVAKSHRSLIARWLKWAVLVHDLRESLAKYTCVGVTGLVNSGKSFLVSKLFDIEIKVGTTNRKRTTVPILYNLSGRVDGLDVIDFPGVDDKDHSIPELAKLLLSFSQIVIFVVDYRRVSSDPCKEWLERLKEEEIPVIVCLTHADRLYVELEESPADQSPIAINHKKRKIGLELDSKKQDIGCLNHPTLHTNFYCFHLPIDSKLDRKVLKEVGIDSPWDVGAQLVDILEKKNKQNDLAKSLRTYLKSRSKSIEL